MPRYGIKCYIDARRSNGTKSLAGSSGELTISFFIQTKMSGADIPVDLELLIGL